MAMSFFFPFYFVPTQCHIYKACGWKGLYNPIFVTVTVQRTREGNTGCMWKVRGDVDKFFCSLCKSQTSSWR